MSDPNFDFERLGLFYLGRTVDPAHPEQVGEPLLYDSRDLVTHAAILGMTGSGKTGLGIALLEEAAIDGVPALVIDPKGDLANLLLAFPDLAPADFLPWVRAEDATRQGITREQLAAAEAEKWRRGLAAWGQDGARIRRLRDAAEVVLYTPGSDVGRPLSILASFAPPSPAVMADADLYRGRIETAATSLLALLGIEADPLRSREHILLASLLDAAWRAGRSYDLAGLIAQIQQPPFAKVGALELENFFPAEDRFALALRLNNLLAAPGFDVWLRGEELALDRLLYGTGGTPRLAVVSIAHLADAERMFVVALLLNEALSWMRTRTGTSSLRALLYMDEVFGYLPPVAEPPSKKPMLALLRQARAFGFGLVLASQNPIDLDYKALSNIGTWVLGRLQTERDKARVLDGLEGAAAVAGAAFDRATMDRLLSGLRRRLFLLHNVHDQAPVLFESRWAMSYLAGPLDREDLRRLAGTAARAGQTAPAPALAPPLAAPKGGSQTPAAGQEVAPGPPLLPPGIPQSVLPAVRPAAVVRYRPALLGIGRAHFEDARLGLATSLESARLALFSEQGALDWSTAAVVTPAPAEAASATAAGATFDPLPARAAQPSNYPKWEKELGATLARSVAVELWRSRRLGQVSRPGESEDAFRGRLAEAARAARDAEVERVRARFDTRAGRLEERLRRAESKVEEQKGQASAQKLQTAVSMGATVLGALFGRRKLSVTTFNRAATSARAASRAGKEARDVELAAASLAGLEAERKALQAEIESALAGIERDFDPARETLERVTVRAKRGDVEVRSLVLAWAPVDARDGTPLWA